MKKARLASTGPDGSSKSRTCWSSSFDAATRLLGQVVVVVVVAAILDDRGS